MAEDKQDGAHGPRRERRPARRGMRSLPLRSVFGEPALIAGGATLMVGLMAVVAGPQMPGVVATSWDSGGEPQGGAPFDSFIQQVAALLFFIAVLSAACRRWVADRLVTPAVGLIVRTVVPLCVVAVAVVIQKNWSVTTWPNARPMGAGPVLAIVASVLGGITWGWHVERAHPALVSWARRHGVRRRA